jgi:hypothetical protein
MTKTYAARYILSPRDANLLIDLFGYDIRAEGDDSVWHSPWGAVLIVVVRW